MSASHDYRKIAELRGLDKVIAAASSLSLRASLIESACQPPNTALEHRLAELWKEILSLDEVGVDDSFFDLSGDSLGMMQMLIRVDEVWHVTISIHQFFEGPTVRQLAAAVTAAQSDSGANISDSKEV